MGLTAERVVKKDVDGLSEHDSSVRLNEISTTAFGNSLREGLSATATVLSGQDRRTNLAIKRKNKNAKEQKQRSNHNEQSSRLRH